MGNKLLPHQHLGGSRGGQADPGGLLFCSCRWTHIQHIYIYIKVFWIKLVYTCWITPLPDVYLVAHSNIFQMFTQIFFLNIKIFTVSSNIPITFYPKYLHVHVYMVCVLTYLCWPASLQDLYPTPTPSDDVTEACHNDWNGTEVLKFMQQGLSLPTETSPQPPNIIFLKINKSKKRKR